jgi:hypothetical protein
MQNTPLKLTRSTCELYFNNHSEKTERNSVAKRILTERAMTPIRSEASTPIGREGGRKVKSEASKKNAKIMDEVKSVRTELLPKLKPNILPSLQIS